MEILTVAMLQHRKVRLPFETPAANGPLTTVPVCTYLDVVHHACLSRVFLHQRLLALQERVEQSRFMLEPDLLARAVLGPPASELTGLR